MKKRGSIIITAAISFLVCVVLAGTLTLTGTFRYSTESYRKLTASRYNMIAISDIALDRAIDYAEGFSVTAIENPVKGDKYYDRLMESVRSEFVFADGSLKGINLKGILEHLNASDVEMQAELKNAAEGMLEGAKISATNAFQIDYENENTKINYTSGDSIVFLPITLKVELSNTTAKVTREVKISGLKCVVSYGDTKVSMVTDSSEAYLLDSVIKM